MASSAVLARVTLGDELNITIVASLLTAEERVVLPVVISRTAVTQKGLSNLAIIVAYTVVSIANHVASQVKYLWTHQFQGEQSRSRRGLGCSCGQRQEGQGLREQKR